MQGDGALGTLTAPPGAAAKRMRVTGGAVTEPATEESQRPISKEAVVARLFEAFSRRDLTGTLELMHPEIVFQPMTAEVTQAGEPYRGHEGIRRYVEDVELHWNELTVEPTQIRAAGRAVVALGIVSGSGPAGSFEDAPTTWVVKFKDDLVWHVQIFSDARYVLEALVGEDV
jgi:ketosteroid isomerase-like protein